MLSLLKERFLEWDSCITDYTHSQSLSESALSKYRVAFHSSKQCLFPHILSNSGPYPSLKFWPTWLVKMVSHLVSRLSIYIPPSVKCLFVSFAHFSTGGPFLFDLYDRDIHPPSVTGVIKLLFPPGSHFVFCKDLVTPLGSWKAQTLLSAGTAPETAVGSVQELSKICCINEWIYYTMDGRQVKEKSVCFSKNSMLGDFKIKCIFWNMWIVFFHFLKFSFSVQFTAVKNTVDLEFCFSTPQNKYETNFMWQYSRV